MSDFKKRPCERQAFCRWCDKTIQKGQNMVSGHSLRNRGINMHFCIPCAKKLGELAHEQA